jgi:hypothetical protein
VADRRPEPPDSGLDPLLEPWGARAELKRVFTASYGPVGFNPSASAGRFRPIFSGPPNNRVPIPTLYAAVDTETAIAEGLLRGVDGGGARRRLFRIEVDGLALSGVAAARELRLARLHGVGLTRLKLLRTELIDSEQEAYAWTARWAQALHDQVAEADGLVWTSRQNDSARAMILWGDRVGPGELVRVGPVVALDRDPGLDVIRQAALDADITFEG